MISMTIETLGVVENSNVNDNNNNVIYYVGGGVMVMGCGAIWYFCYYNKAPIFDINSDENPFYYFDYLVADDKRPLLSIII